MNTMVRVCCNNCKKIFKREEVEHYSSYTSKMFAMLRGLPVMDELFFCASCLKKFKDFEEDSE